MLFLVCVLTLSIVSAHNFTADRPGFDIIWFADGILLSVLLLAPRWRWLGYLLAGFAGLFLGSILIHETINRSLFFSALNVLEVWLPAQLLRPKSTLLPDFTRLAYLMRFLAFVCVPGQLVSSLLNGLHNVLLHEQPFWPSVAQWFFIGCLGIFCVTPAVVAILSTRLRRKRRVGRRWLVAAAFLASTLAIFTLSHLPLLHLTYPLLVVVTLYLPRFFAWRMRMKAEHPAKRGMPVLVMVGDAAPTPAN